MKKLFAVMLALCLLGSFALADEVVEISWEQVGNDTIMENGAFQQISIPDVGNIVYFVPNVMSAVDVSTLQADVLPAAAYQTEDGKFTLSVYALNIPGLEDYLTSLQGQGTENFKNVKVNGIDCIAAENKANGLDILIVPVTETMVLSFIYTPLDGDEGWDQMKSVMVASIQVAQ